MRIRGYSQLASMLAGALLLACGDTTQTVGRIRAAVAERGVPAPGTSSGTGGRASEIHSADAGQSMTATRTPTRTPNGSAGGAAGGAVANSAPSSEGTGGSTAVIVPAVVEQCMGALPASRRQLDLYLMVDTNITLPLAGGWDNVRNGLMYYVSEACAAGIGVGVRYFGVDCNADSYAMPTTPVAPLPDNADTIKKEIPVAPFNLSPTLPALEGALMYSRARAVANPDSKQAVVLVSDGFADFYCTGPNGIPNIFATTTPSSDGVPIYVLALDAPNLANVPTLAALLDPVTRFSPLETIAKNGGSGQALHIDLQASASAFGQAMLQIQHEAEPCDFRVPDSVHADPIGNVLGTAANNGHSIIPLVASANACGQGYYLDDMSDPHWATLCPDTCATVNATCASVDWVSGCR